MQILRDLLSDTALNVKPRKMHENNIAFVTGRQTSLQIYLLIARGISKARNAIKWRQEERERREKIENVYLGVRFNLISIVDSSRCSGFPTDAATLHGIRLSPV